VVFGVQIPGTEGRACMCVLRTVGLPDLAALEAYFEAQLPSYQRPLFLRFTSGPVRTTSTFKQQTASYREEGFDPSRFDDALFVSRGGRFEPCDAGAHAAIMNGEWVPS